MKRNINNTNLLQLMERKQQLLLRIKAAITLGRMDLMKELSHEFRDVLEKEHNLTKNKENIDSKMNHVYKKVKSCDCNNRAGNHSSNGSER